MRFFQIIASGAALVASVIAQSSTLAINSYPSSGVEAGKSYTITYSPKDDVATTFLLRKGPSTDLTTISTLTSSATGGSFTWTVDSTLVNGNDYALEIQQGDENNYSAQFSLTGGSAVVSSAVSSAASSAAASASSVASSAGYAASSVVSSASYAASSAASSKASSLSSRVSSAASSMITSQSSMMMMSSAVSGVISSSAHNNGTVSSATLSRSSSSAKATSSVTTTGPSIPESTGAASMLTSSPLALIFGAVAAMMYLN